MGRIVAVRAVVVGRVQGVGFRAFVEREAAALGVHGWVRNRRDGTVEVHVEGADPPVERLLDALRRGPAPARVTGLERRPASVEGHSRFARASDA